MDQPESTPPTESPVTRLERRQDEVLAQLSTLEASIEELIQEFKLDLRQYQLPKNC